MRTLLSIAVMSLLFCVGTSAQNQSRKVLYTLAPNEIIETGEYEIQCRLDGYRFALLTLDTITEKNTLVFNGRRIELTESAYELRDFGIDVNKSDGYSFIYKKDNEYFVNKGGKIEGPYEYAGWKDWFSRDNGYMYVLADRAYDNVNGKISTSKGIYRLYGFKRNGMYYVAKNGILEPYDCDGSVVKNGNNYAYVGQIDKRYYLWLNRRQIDSRARIGYVCVNARGDYAYDYVERYHHNSHGYADSCHVVKNGVRINPKGYGGISDLNLSENGDVAYIGDGRKLHLPGMAEDAEFESVHHLTYFDSEWYGFVYKKDGKSYVRLKGQEDKGPYDGYISLIVKSNGAFMYHYRNNDYSYVKTDKSEYGPFDSVWLRDIENGDYHFTCHKDNKEYVYRNGIMTTINDYRDGIGIDTDSHSFYSHYDYDYVVIDGQRVGNSAAIGCRYDESKNAFVWYSIEGRELAIYEYALD